MSNILDRARNRRSGLRVHLQTNNVTGWTRVRTACGRNLDHQKSWIVTADGDGKVTCQECLDAMEPA